MQVAPVRGLVEAADGLEQRRRIDRLGDVIVHARGETALALLHRGVRRHRDDRQRRKARIGAQLRRRLIAVHLRHLEVHQHDVERCGARDPTASRPPRGRCWRS